MLVFSWLQYVWGWVIPDPPFRCLVETEWLTRENGEKKKAKGEEDDVAARHRPSVPAQKLLISSSPCELSRSLAGHEQSVIVLPLPLAGSSLLFSTLPSLLLPYFLPQHSRRA